MVWITITDRLIEFASANVKLGAWLTIASTCNVSVVRREHCSLSTGGFSVVLSRCPRAGIAATTFGGVAISCGGAEVVMSPVCRVTSIVAGHVGPP